MQHAQSPGAGQTARSVSVVLAGSGGAGVMTAGNMLLEQPHTPATTRS